MLSAKRARHGVSESASAFSNRSPSHGKNHAVIPLMRKPCSMRAQNTRNCAPTASTKSPNV